MKDRTQLQKLLEEKGTVFLSEIQNLGFSSQNITYMTKIGALQRVDYRRYKAGAQIGKTSRDDKKDTTLIKEKIVRQGTITTHELNNLSFSNNNIQALLKKNFLVRKERGIYVLAPTVSKDTQQETEMKKTKTKPRKTNS